MHLLLTDVVLPSMTGWQVAAQVRALKPGCRVLFMSAHALERFVEDATFDGHASFLHKPFGKEVLLRHAREALHSPEPAPT